MSDAVDEKNSNSNEAEVLSSTTTNTGTASLKRPHHEVSVEVRLCASLVCVEL